jgi:hypothetical protein
MTTQTFTPEELIELLASEGSIARGFSFVRAGQVSRTIIHLLAGYTNRDGLSIFRLTADVSLSNLRAKVVAEPGWNITELPTNSADLRDAIDGWLSENNLRLWGLATPVLYSADQDSQISAFAHTDDIFTWALIHLQQSIVSGMGPNSPFATGFLYGKLCDLVLDIQNAKLASSGRSLKK